MTRAQQVGVIVGLVIVTALTLLRASDPLFFRLARETVFDEYQRLAPRPFEDVPVRVVDIDEASLKVLGQWPWPRDRLARLVERLSDMGVAAIAFDILFSEPDRLSPRSVVREVEGVSPELLGRLPDNDAVFARSFEGRPIVLGFGISNDGRFLPQVKAGFAFTGEPPFGAPPQIRAATPLLPEFEQNATGIGHISLDPGNPSSVVRTMPLLLSDGQQLYPNLMMEALRIAQGASTYVLANAPDRADTIMMVKVGAFVIPVTAAGEMWLYVTPDRAERYVSAAKVLADGGPPDEVRAALQGAIVFVGTSAAGLQDIRTTALGQHVPGVSIHAQAAEQVLTGRFLSRPDWADGLEIVSIALAGILIVQLTMAFSPAIALAFGLLVTVAALGASWLAFLYAGLLLDPLAPIVCGTITHFAVTAFRILVIDRERREVRRAFGKYLSPELLHRVEHTRDALQLGGDERQLTVMFVDVRDFTAISEHRSPKEVVAFLNLLLDALSRDVIAHEGMLDKFIGDSIMAFWNAPVDVADHGAKAVRAALAMRRTLARLNARDAFGFGGQKVAIGIGIHTGLACVGNMGAEVHFNYSAVGDTVNIAARIEAASKEVGYDVLISDSTARGLSGMALLEAGALALRGRQSRTQILAVVGDEQVAATGAFTELSALHARLVEALRARSGRARDLVRLARQKATAFDAALPEFYRRMGRRGEHFQRELEDPPEVATK
ncbi:adenylate/guanylate cyclase domain-containing protein [Rhizobium sp. TRM96647]|uniref:CHASE2 domain-containing protein n=1 Tax=unclassified Rhizobium TaxID=2613769 RepID=UPI0021E86FF1|nr:MULTISPECIES: adenylate/guanylate cyclase domain-containing protein [unclassified Rhizobium]MCV3737974.1 adenylate/guanylate cyclase domain-containing protein [Rhizobium sp. TRM96647]MCV3759661.1 adenylate/guanylate cyclase domain-containing protein [Rhizobium sp. TRM96650]